MAFEITYKIDGGWGLCTITCDAQSVTVKGDTLRDGLGNMATAVIGILTDNFYTKAYFAQDLCYKYRIVFEWDAGNIRILTGESDDNDEYEEFTVYDDEYYYKPIFECTCTPAELLTATMNCLQNVRDTYGIREYNDRWYKYGFPQKQLQQLKSMAQDTEYLTCPIPDDVMTWWQEMDRWQEPFQKVPGEFWYWSFKKETFEAIKKELEVVAKIGETTTRSEPIPQIIALKAHCYLMAGIVYLWNEKYDKALALEKFFFTKASRNENWHIIYDYLALLIGSGKTEHLDALFSEPAFKKQFDYAYTAYIAYNNPSDKGLHSQAWVIRNNARRFANHLAGR
jgi:hypothetical protein